MLNLHALFSGFLCRSLAVCVRLCVCVCLTVCAHTHVLLGVKVRLTSECTSVVVCVCWSVLAVAGMGVFVSVSDRFGVTYWGGTDGVVRAGVGGMK